MHLKCGGGFLFCFVGFWFLFVLLLCFLLLLFFCCCFVGFFCSISFGILPIMYVQNRAAWVFGAHYYYVLCRIAMIAILSLPPMFVFN